MIPGPSSMLALTQGARYGWTAGILSGLGNVFASVLQAVITYIIIWQIGEISVAFLRIIKYTGAAYIIYLGLMLLKIESFDVAPEVTDRSDGNSLIGYFSDGFVFAIFNPKALTFFAAMFPQFVSGGSINVKIVMLIFTPIAIISFSCFIFYVFTGRLVMKVINETRHIGRLFGSLIILSGIIFSLS
jgi:threonine/homoserine/homoserine lactone efflux protein